MLTAYELCKRQLIAVAQDLDFCLSSEDLDEDEAEKIQKLYDEIVAVLEKY